MPRRIRGLPGIPKFDLDVFRRFLSPETMQALEADSTPTPPVETPAAPPRSVFDELPAVAYVPNLRREPIPGRDPEARGSGVQEPQRPSNQDELAETARIARELAAKPPRVEGSIPAHGQPPPHLVDRVRPTDQRIMREGIGSTGVQKLYEQDPFAETWMAANESDLRFRDKQARDQAALKALDKGVYDFEHGPGAWQREWDKTLVRPGALWAKEKMQLRAAPFDEAVLDPKNEALPDDYEAVEVPDGRGLTLNPEAKEKLWSPGGDTPTRLPHLGKITQEIQRKSGTGLVQEFMPSRVPWDEHVEATVQQLEKEGRFDRALLQPVWDRIHGTYFRDEAGARSAMLNFLGDILEHSRRARNTQPGEFGGRVTRYRPEFDEEEQAAMRAHDAAMAAYTANRGFAEGVQSEGFAEREKKIDLSDNYAQLEEQNARELTSGEGFQGNQAVGAERDAFGRGKLRTLDELQSDAVGQNPLKALRRKGGAVLDQTENLRRGLVDLAIVPRDTVKVGHARFGEPGLEPYETEVLKVIPLATEMKPGFLEDVSRRLLLPTETLIDAVASTRAAAVDGEMDFDIVQVRKPTGKVGQDLPPVGRVRHPDTFEWFAGDKGAQAKTRLAQHPKIQELLLHDVQGSVVRAVKGRGQDILGVIYIKGKPVAVGKPDPRTGRYRFYRMRIDPQTEKPTFRYEPQGRNKGKPYEGKDPFPQGLLEARGKPETAVRTSDQVRTPFFPAGHPETQPGRDVRLPRADDTVRGAMGKPLLEEELQASMPSFSRGQFGDEATQSKPLTRQEVPLDDPTMPEGSMRLETQEEAIARSLSEGAPRDIRAVAQEAGIELSPTPVRGKLSRGINWRLAGEPRKFDKGQTRAKRLTQSWPVAQDTSKAEVIFVFTGRIPNKTNIDAITRYEAKPGSREIVNPTDEEVRHILQHSGITRAVIKVVEPDSLAEAQNLWHRATAVVNGAVNPRGTGNRRPIQKKGNPNWEQTGTDAEGKPIWSRRIGDKAAPSAVTPQGGPALVGGGGEAEQLARIAKAQFERDPSPRGEQPLSKGPLTEEEELVLMDKRKAREEAGALQPQANPNAPTRKGFLDTVRAMNQRRGQEVVRNAFPEWKPSGKWGKVFGVGGAMVGAHLASQMVPGENQAEAAGGRKITGKMADVAEAREAMHAPATDYVPEFFRTFMAKTLNFFEPIYDTANQKIGADAEKALRHTFQTQHGGIVGQAEMRYEPVRLMREKFDAAGQTENLAFFMNKAQNLYAWDNAARKKAQLHREAEIEAANGNIDRAKRLRQEALDIDTQMAERTLTEFGGTKDSEINELRQLRDQVGPEMYDSFRRGANVVYKAVQEMIDDLHNNGQLTDEDWSDLKAKGLNYIPNLTTSFAKGPDGKLRWTGGKHIEQFSKDVKGVQENLLGRDEWSEKILADPLTSAARFITEGTAQIARTNMANKVVDVFEPAGLAKRVDPNKKPVHEHGNEFYTFMRGGEAVTYEMPKQIVDSLLMADQNFTDRFVQNLPGQKAMGIVRSISESGATTANFGWAALQSALFDPAAAIMQLPSKDRRIARRIIPFMGGVLKNAKDNLLTANRGRASSPLRQEAARHNVLYAGAAADLADYSQIEGRDTSNRISRAFGEGKVGEGLQRGVKKGLNVLSDRFTKPLDEAVKMTAFDMLRKERAKGLNDFGDEELSYLARTRGGSGDWNQRGSADAWVRTLVSFGRPTMLANETAIRSGWQQKGKLTKVMLSMLAAEGARRGMNSFAADELGMDQDELQKRYSRHDQDNSMIFMIPPSMAKAMNNGEGMEIGANGIERPFAVKIPIPPILRVWTAPLKGLAKAYETGNPSDVIVGGVVGTIDEMLPGSVPLRYDDSRAATKDLLRRGLSVLPAPYRLPLEQYYNVQGFTGAPVVGSRLIDREPSEQYSSSTEPFYKDLGQAINVSPQRLQHLGRGVAPGLFQILPQAYNLAAPLPRDAQGNVIRPVEQSPIERLNRIPLVGEVTKRLTPQRYEEELSSAQDQFYDLSARSKSAAAAVNDFEQGTATAMPSEMTRYLAMANPEVQGLVRGLAEISDAQKQVMNSATMSPREKRDAMRDLLNMRRDALRQFLAVPAVKSLVGGEIPEQ